MAIENLITDHLDLWTAAVRPKSSAGRGSNSKLELTGIKKLRELILELAVRGKLVPQDPSDEPASVLLERVAAEKTRLVKEGKIKKPKTLPKISEEEKPFGLPEGWEWVTLGSLGVITSSSRVNKKDWVATGVPFFRTREIVQLSKFGICDNELFISERLYDELISSGTVPEKNDVMLTGVGTIGIPYVVIEHDRFYFKDASVLIFKNIFNLWPNYLDLFFRSPCWIEQIHDGSMGTTVHTLTIVRANAIKIPIPPAEEQLRIVAKVGELMALCDQLEQCSESQLSAHQTLVETLLATLTDSTDADKLAQNWARLSTHFDTLFTTEASIDALKQTILQLAVMGKLVSQDPSDEPASALLERIAAEKALLVKEKKIKKEKPLPEISENEKPFELPKGWEWCRLGALMPQFQNGASSRGDSGGIPITVLRLADIKDWKVSLADTRELSIDSKSIDKYSLEKGDTLIIRVNGSSDIVGRFIGCDENYDAIYCDHFIRMRFLVEVFNTRYLSLLGSSNIVRSKIADLFISTAGQKTVNQGHISSIVLPLPSITEQHRIVAKVDELMTLCDQLKSRLQTNQQTQLALAESLAEGALA
ncbi:restriction endonuclease subunit S [Aeromonas caviae]|uniref:restriction endonuclease subunit S n=1 Tax=Aeromonas caviae TaxID=648 RepID=UPI001940C310|nr:restriction endonuclease subunit S [Aeromonas caviae]BCR31245.1 type I restriction endonuclease EcoAI subunit S [Aeromonas caviae]GJA98129.1 type I restriction endonuclease EcoAI subunit S [Aeromonas caviae]GJB41411.1 type I restriction endonuclease EcoAI subunit S [Aeromonas caviae]GJB45529.1 type I restriction endonuclease EcoAI subunit S [Aeromonas caviae]GJB50608.1 type I restriction endonuclease EcoAI subunit S [Aeromonas caviae]